MVYSNVFPTFPGNYVATIFLSVHNVLVVCVLASLCDSRPRPLIQMLKEEVFNGDLFPEEVVDYHVHIVGHNDCGSHCYIHNSAKTWWNPLKRLKTAILMSAAQVPPPHHAFSHAEFKRVHDMYPISYPIFFAVLYILSMYVCM